MFNAVTILRLLQTVTLASAVAVNHDQAIGKRAATTSTISGTAQLSSAYAQATAAGSALEGIFTQIVPAPGPTSVAQAESEINAIFAANPQDFFKSSLELLTNGLAGGDFVDIANAYLFESSINNVNLINPNPPIYPKASPSDAPYSLTEAQLRKAIYIPPTFTYGQKPIAIFLPGTAAVSGQSFGPNLGKLLVKDNVADPIYVNLPGTNLADIQVAAEYAAYAVNYISAISGHKNVSTISWSAGSLDGQWALKYWPSVRSVLSNKIGISPDYHGTVLAKLLCPGFQTPGCTAAIAQQDYNSNFISVLRANGGDSAYVPTTNIYSIFDEIVQPQADPNASGALGDARGVGVSNVELQKSCSAVLPGGQVNVNHEGVLYNALAYALVKDAIQNPGPGQLSRVNVAAECSKVAATGLSLADVLATHATIPIAAFNIIVYQPKSSTGPPIKAYAA